MTHLVSGTVTPVINNGETSVSPICVDTADIRYISIERSATTSKAKAAMVGTPNRCPPGTGRILVPGATIYRFLV